MTRYIPAKHLNYRKYTNVIKNEITFLTIFTCGDYYKNHK